MGNEAGEWIMYGVDWDDPECIHTVEEAVEYLLYGAKRVLFLQISKSCI